MKDLLAGKKILVAGAGGLLGAQLTKAMLQQGAEVIAADIDPKTMTKKIASLGIEVSAINAVELDLTDEKDVKAFFSQCGVLSGAVNASYPRNKRYGAHFFDVSMDSFNENLSLHLGSAFLFTQQCAAHYSKTRNPFSLVNIASIYGVMAPKFDIYEGTHMTMPVEYAAIKSAILNLSRYAAAYVNDSGFRVNCVSPGGIFDNQPDAFLAAYRKNTHGTGMLDAADITGSIMFLLSDHARHVTGQNIIVDDGFTL